MSLPKIKHRQDKTPQKEASLVGEGTELAEKLSSGNGSLNNRLEKNVQMWPEATAVECAISPWSSNNNNKKLHSHPHVLMPQPPMVPKNQCKVA